jgi:hypothetical protein
MGEREGERGIWGKGRGGWAGQGRLGRPRRPTAREREKGRRERREKERKEKKNKKRFFSFSKSVFSWMNALTFLSNRKNAWFGMVHQTT